MDGVEYVDPSKRNTTLRVVLEQEFFTNIQQNFINQILAVISRDLYNLTIANDFIVTVPNVGSLNFSIWNANLKNMSINNKTELVTLGEDNSITLNLLDLKGEVNASYRYITDPPILADVGDFDWDWNETDLNVGGAIYLNEHHTAEVRLDVLSLQALPFAINLDGVSDIS